ncbi:MAG: Hsp20/alpha crystallin family protein [Erysipelotrichaceae bacterium]|nr:Hsp20/alpha crystallin family protein [Erysipelotrichaceae bacterium]
MLMPKVFRREENLFDDWFDHFDLMDREMEQLNRKLYGKHSNREMLTDVKEHEDHYDVVIDLPGFKKDEINVELNDGYLTISAQKGHDEEEKNKAGKLIRQERYSGMMSRSFYVGDQVGVEEIHGKYEGGVLTLSVPKKEEQKETGHNNRIMIEG